MSWSFVVLGEALGAVLRQTMLLQKRNSSVWVLALSLFLPTAMNAEDPVVAWKESPVLQSCTGPTDNLGYRWYNASFNDSTWASASFPDVLGSGTQSSIFYRGRLTLAAPVPLWIQLASDDGAELYVNGHFAGQYGNGSCPAGGCVNLPDQCAVNQCLPPIAISTAQLVAGLNVIAIHKWNISGSSSYFRVSVTATPPGTCGDCVVQSSEQCDAARSDTVCGPGLQCRDPGTAAPCTCGGLCGNGLLDSGEQCDDGNVDNGDCCSSLCAINAGGSCDDGLSCNGSEQCQSGVCVPSTSPCGSQACDETTGACYAACPSLPQTCTTADESILKLRITDDGKRDRLIWKAFGKTFVQEPRIAPYVLCLYQGEPATLVNEYSVSNDPFRWITTNDGNVVKYRDPARIPNGVKKLIVKQFPKPRWGVLIKGSGPNLPISPLHPSFPFTVQLLDVETGSCWSQSYVSGQLHDFAPGRINATNP